MATEQPSLETLLLKIFQRLVYAYQGNIDFDLLFMSVDVKKALRHEKFKELFDQLPKHIKDTIESPLIRDE